MSNQSNIKDFFPCKGTESITDKNNQQSEMNKSINNSSSSKRHLENKKEISHPTLKKYKNEN